MSGFGDFFLVSFCILLRCLSRAIAMLAVTSSQNSSTEWSLWGPQNEMRRGVGDETNLIWNTYNGGNATVADYGL